MAELDSLLAQQITTFVAPRRALPELSADPGAISTVAREFEAAFLTEMLKLSGVADPAGTFGGGQGEAAFSEFLIREYANEIARTKPLGIGARVAEQLARQGLE